MFKYNSKYIIIFLFNSKFIILNQKFPEFEIYYFEFIRNEITFHFLMNELKRLKRSPQLEMGKVVAIERNLWISTNINDDDADN